MLPSGSRDVYREAETNSSSKLSLADAVAPSSELWPVWSDASRLGVVVKRSKGSRALVLRSYGVAGTSRLTSVMYT